jgi:hypothetical protein
MRRNLRIVALAWIGFSFWGCAALSPAPEPGTGKKSTVTVDNKASDLQGLRPALHTLEDSLVLDVLLGYR